jgi:tetratricopeptide (TPR) repeat protein
MGEASRLEIASQALYEEGWVFFEQNRPAEALQWFEEAYLEDSDNARLRSSYGLCLGIVERRFDKAMELCQSAAKQEFFNPDLYLNLARLNLVFGFKSEGLRYLRRGEMIDPANAGIEAVMRDLGMRVSPVLGFLPRRHVLNRWLGSARHFLFRRQSESEAEHAAA